jgi:hypothetical protein
VIATASWRGGQQTRHEDRDRGQDGQHRQAHPQRLDPIPEPLLIAVLDDPLSTLWGRLSPAW